MLRWNSSGVTVAGLTGSAGNGNNQLNAPIDVVLDWAQNLYIVDSNNHRVQKYLFGSSVGTTVAGNGIPGGSPSQLRDPSRVLVDLNGNLYVSDNTNSRIQFWPQDATNGTTVAGVTGQKKDD